MKIIFQSYAKYNKAVNQEVLKLVEPLAQEKIFQRSKAYYPSIIDTLSHIFNTDIAWLRRFKAAFPESRALSDSVLVAADKDAIKNEIQNDYKRLFIYRKELDEAAVQFIEWLDGDRLNSIVKFINNRGEHVEKELWKLLMQWFNHQTHHRGQVSVQLDLVDVFNDYSSLLTKI